MTVWGPEHTRLASSNYLPNTVVKSDKENASLLTVGFWRHEYRNQARCGTSYSLGRVNLGSVRPAAPNYALGSGN